MAMLSLLLSFLLLISLCANAMTLEEKVGQILLVHFHGPEINEDAKILAQEVKVGGFVYYDWANQLSEKNQILNLSKQLQAMSLTPLC